MDRDSQVPRIQKRFPGANAVAWEKYHLRYSPPSTYFHGIVRDRSAPARGPFFTDVDGNVLMDFVSNICASPFGYNNPELLEFINELPRQDPDRYAGTDFMVGYGKSPGKSKVPTPSDLHHKLVKICRPLGLDCSYFSNSGTEAVENAMKICFLKNPQMKHFFSFDGAFHGRTLGSLTLTRSKKVHRTGFPHIPYAESLPFCSCKEECVCSWKVIGLDGKSTNALDAHIGDAAMINPKEVAFIIVEPVQGEGGYKIANKSFLKEMVRTANDAQIPVVVDEIQSGMGRTGKWWAVEHFGVKPDVLCAAKALRVGATIGRRDMFPKEEGKIAGTWCEGNALATSVGYKTMEMIERHKILAHASKVGRYFLNRLSQIEGADSSHARGLGLMLAFDAPTSDRRNTMIQQCLQHGLVLAPAGPKSVRIIPPLDVTRREIDIAMGILDQVCR